MPEDPSYDELRHRVGALESELRDARNVLRSKELVEAALGASEAHKHALMQATSDALYTLSADWKVLKRLSGAGVLSGITPPDRTWLRTLVAREDRPRVLAAIRTAVRTGSVFELEHKVRRQDGGVGWARSRAVPVLGADGAIVEWFGSASDITARKQAEEALLASKERQTFLLMLGDVLRPLRRTADIQAAASRLLGEFVGADRVCCCDIEGHPGKRVAIVRGEWAADGSALPARMDYEPFERGWALRACSPGLPVAVADVERDPRPGDGIRAAWRSVGIRALIVVGLVHDGCRTANFSIMQGVPRAWSPAETMLVQQVAERTWAAVERAKVQAALHEQEEQLRQTIELAPVVLWWADPSGKTVVVTSQWGAYTGQTHDEMQDFGWLDAIHPDDLAGTRAAVEHAFATGEAIERQQRIRKQGAGFHWHVVRQVPVRNGEGTITRWFGTATDIHDLHQYRTRQELLVGELQHRTRNLITVVRSLSDRTLDNATGLVDFSERFSERLAALSRVQGLLSRLSGGARVAFDQLLRIELAALGASGDNITLDGPAGVPLRSTTVQLFALAVHELAANAARHGALSPAGGHLHVRWRVEPASDGTGHMLHVDWSEKGVAMPDGPVPSRTGGYGRRLIEAGLPYQLGAKTSHELRPDGVWCRIAVPLPPARPA